MKASELVKAVTSSSYLHNGDTVTIKREHYSAMVEAIREKAEREEQERKKTTQDEMAKSYCSVSIAGGLVHGEFEQVKAVQALILENEKLRREAREREEQDRPVYSLKEQIADIDDEFSGTDTAGNAAATTLRKLYAEGGEFLQEIVLIERLHKFLRALGVEKTP